MLKVGKPIDHMNLSELGRIRTTPFLVRLLVYLTLAGAAIAWILATRGALALPGMALLGLVFAHGVELQHQALHNTGFRGRAANRLTGFLLGLPMLVSFSDYQHSHLRHHRLLGTGEDREFFNYGYDQLTSLKPLLRHLLMIGHYRSVAGFMAGALLGRIKPDIEKRRAAVRIRTEYQAMAAVLVLVAGSSAYLRTDLFLRIWLFPLLFAIPIHALVELPEHWGRDRATPDVLTNTRTIRTSWLLFWFTNGNNYHIEHHWMPAVPIDRLPELHNRIAHRIEVDTYSAFYRRFFQELYRNTFSRRREEELA